MCQAGVLHHVTPALVQLKLKLHMPVSLLLGASNWSAAHFGQAMMAAVSALIGYAYPSMLLGAAVMR
jgi:hypothetical protein